MSKNTESHSQFSSGIDALTKGLRISFIMFVAIIAMLLGWYIFIKGYFVVESQEVVLLSKFGKLTEECNTGWYWRFPKPVYAKTRIPLTPQKLIINHHWLEEVRRGFAGKLKGSAFTPGRNGYLLSADTNIFHTKWEVIYQISNPKKYYTLVKTPAQIAKGKDLRADDIEINSHGEEAGSRGPKTLLRNLIANIILKVSAATKIEDALYDSKNYKIEVEKLAIIEVNKMDIGIEVINVLPAVKPTAPKETAASFQKVTQVRQERKTSLMIAKGYEIKAKGLGEIEASRIITEADAYKINVVSEIKAEQKYFKAILAKYKKNSYIKNELYLNVLADIFGKIKDKYIIKTNENGTQQVRIKINPEPKIKDEKVGEK